MTEQELRKIAQEEISKQILKNIDSSLIFSYVSELEKNNIPRRKIEEKIQELKNIKGDYMTCVAINERIAVLEELLESKE